MIKETEKLRWTCSFVLYSVYKFYYINWFGVVNPPLYFWTMVYNPLCVLLDWFTSILVKIFASVFMIYIISLLMFEIKLVSLWPLFLQMFFLTLLLLLFFWSPHCMHLEALKGTHTSQQLSLFFPTLHKLYHLYSSSWILSFSGLNLLLSYSVISSF